MTSFDCHRISEGHAEGELLTSSDDMCFYLVNPEDGTVIEEGHALQGVSVAGKILSFPNGKGSSVVQADGLYQLQKTGNAPRAMIIRNPDTTLVASAIILEIPLVDRLGEEFYRTAHDGQVVDVDADAQRVTLVGPPPQPGATPSAATPGATSSAGIPGGATAGAATPGAPSGAPSGAPRFLPIADVS